MIPVPLLIGGAIVLVLALVSRAGASTPSGGSGGSSRSSAGSPPAGTGGVVARFGALATAMPSPFPPGALLEVIRHESGGKPEVVVADQVTGASELGACQLVVEHDAAGNPDEHSGSGAIGADVDPLDPAGAVWGAQWVYAKAKERHAKDLRDLRIVVPDDTEVGIWIMIMHAQHSIGRLAFQRLMSGAKAAGKSHPLAALLYWRDTKLPPKIGKMGGLLIRKRVRGMLQLPELAARNAALPSRIGPLPERPGGIPRFDAARAKRYILAERRRGTKPRAANGAPPGV